MAILDFLRSSPKMNRRESKNRSKSRNEWQNSVVTDDREPKLSWQGTEENREKKISLKIGNNRKAYFNARILQWMEKKIRC